MKEFNSAMFELGLIANEKEEVNELFNTIDVDRSGIINVDELATTLQKLLDPSAHEHLEELLEKNESLSSSIVAMREKLTQNAARVIDLFKQWDNDGDGTISRSEFVKAMPMLGLQDCLPIEINALFSAFDPSGDGDITFRELHRMLRQEVPKKKKVVEKQVVKIPIVELEQARREAKEELLKMNLKNEVAVEIYEMSESEQRAIEAKRQREGAKAKEAEEETVPMTEQEKALQKAARDKSIWNRKREPKTANVTFGLPDVKG